MDVSAKIPGIKYSPFLCRELRVWDISDKEFESVAVLKLTNSIKFTKEKLRSSQLESLRLLNIEAVKNSFLILINGNNLEGLML